MSVCVVYRGQRRGWSTFLFRGTPPVFFTLFLALGSVLNLLDVPASSLSVTLSELINQSLWLPGFWFYTFPVLFVCFSGGYLRQSSTAYQKPQVLKPCWLGSHGSHSSSPFSISSQNDENNYSIRRIQHCDVYVAYDTWSSWNTFSDMACFWQIATNRCLSLGSTEKALEADRLNYEEFSWEAIPLNSSG